MLAERLKWGVDGEVGVFLLDPDGGEIFKLRGWRGREIFVGLWEAPPEVIADSVASDVDMPLEVHAIIPGEERAWIVLRAKITDRDAPPERKQSGEYVKLRPSSQRRAST